MGTVTSNRVGVWQDRERCTNPGRVRRQELPGPDYHSSLVLYSTFRHFYQQPLSNPVLVPGRVVRIYRYAAGVSA